MSRPSHKEIHITVPQYTGDLTLLQDNIDAETQHYATPSNMTWGPEEIWLVVSVEAGSLQVHRGNGVETHPYIVETGGMLRVNAQVVSEIFLKNVGATLVQAVIAWTSDPNYAFFSKGST